MKYFKCRDFKLALSKRPLIMGILNITPDSFSENGKYFSKSAAIKQALKMVKDGADIIDVGGESTRPGSKPVKVSEEIKRIIPVIRELSKRIDKPISVDTYKDSVARKALESGASIVNDITGLRSNSPNMPSLIAEYNAGVVIMHMQGNPLSMQKNPKYRNVVSDIKSFLKKQAKIAINAGISKNNIIVDPGIGFGKNLSHNLKIIKQIDKFEALGFPVLIGLSRKSFIGKIFDLDVKDRLIPTITSNLLAMLAGASLLRVHDVKETNTAIEMASQILEA